MGDEKRSNQISKPVDHCSLVASYCIAPPTLQTGSSDYSGISSADIATALLLSVVRTSENPLAAAEVLLAHAAKLHTVNTYADIIINQPHLLFSHAFSINPTQ